MKKYTQDIEKLYETVGFEKIEKGKSYTTGKGGKVTIEDIYIDATQELAEAYVNYEFETSEGEKLKETNRFSVVVDMIRSK
jgi:hypothetical protein